MSFFTSVLHVPPVILLHLIILIIFSSRVQIIKLLLLLLLNLLYLSSNIFMSTQDVSLCSSLRVNGKVSHPYKIIFFSCLMFRLLDKRREDESEMMLASISRVQSALRFFYNEISVYFYRSQIELFELCNVSKKILIYLIIRIIILEDTVTKRKGCLPCQI